MDWASRALRSDKEAMLKFLRHRKDVFPYVADSLLEDPSFVNEVGTDPKLGRQLVKGILQRNWRSLDHVPEFMKSDPEIILTSARVDWHAIDTGPHYSFRLLDCRALEPGAQVSGRQEHCKSAKEMVEDFYDCWYHPKIALAAVEQDYRNMLNLNSAMQLGLTRGRDCCWAPIGPDRLGYRRCLHPCILEVLNVWLILNPQTPPPPPPSLPGFVLVLGFEPKQKGLLSQERDRYTGNLRVGLYNNTTYFEALSGDFSFLGSCRTCAPPQQRLAVGLAIGACRSRTTSGRLQVFNSTLKSF